MDRRKFIGDLGSPVLAVCAVCLGACSKGGNSPSNGNPGGGGGVNFAVNLNSQLPNVGDSLVQSGVIVARVAAGNAVSSFAAVQVACTHQGAPINYSSSGNKFICSLHHSQFNTNGTVISGPDNGGTATALKVYNIAINGSTMTITG